MNLDPVHDLQAVFRRLVRAFSYPGRPVDLSSWTNALDLPPDFETDLYPSTFLVLLTLVDSETSFAVFGDDAETTTRRTVEWASGRPTQPHDARFLVVRASNASEIELAFDTANRGTLLEPHAGATVLVETGSANEGTPCRLSGPGIESSLVRTLPLTPLQIQARSRANREFPLGIDVVLFGSSGELTALPRTTRIDLLEVK